MTTQLTQRKLVRRNAHKLVAQLRASHTQCVVHADSDYYQGRACPPEFAWEGWRRLHNATVHMETDGSLTVRLHDARWYKLTEPR